jgi:hypothetical protein
MGLNMRTISECKNCKTEIESTEDPEVWIHTKETNCKKPER